MGLLRLLLLLMLLGGSAAAQSPTYGLGRTPTEEEIRAWDISIGPTGEELPPGRGTPEEGELVYRRGCATCHGANGVGGSAPRLIKREAEPGAHPWDYGRVLPIRAPYATGVWDYINRGMPLNREDRFALGIGEIYGEWNPALQIALPFDDSHEDHLVLTGWKVGCAQLIEYSVNTELPVRSVACIRAKKKNCLHY